MHCAGAAVHAPYLEPGRRRPAAVVGRAASASPTCSTRSASTSAAGSGVPLDRIQQVAVKADRPARQVASRISSVVDRRGRPRRRAVAGRGLDQGAGQPGDEHGVVAYRQTSATRISTVGRLVRQPRVEVDHAVIEQRPRSRTSASTSAPGSARPSRRARSVRRSATGSRPGNGSWRSRCRRPASTGSWPTAPRSPGARPGSGPGRPRPPRSSSTPTCTWQPQVSCSTAVSPKRSTIAW